MKKVVILFFLAFVLVGCAQNQPLPAVYAPVSAVIYDGASDCEGARIVGESCASNCDCARPSECLEGACALIKQNDGAPCKYNKQCKHGYCTDSGQCGGPTGPNATYYCKKECSPKSNGRSTYPCYTVCRYSEVTRNY